MRRNRRTKLDAGTGDAAAGSFVRSLAVPGEPSPEERLHYLGAAVHAAPPVLAVEAMPVREEFPREEGMHTVSLRARESVMRNTLIACGAGLAPLPLADLAGGTFAIHSMLRTLGELYGCADDSWRGSASVALLATLGAIGCKGIVAGLALRLMPLGGAALARAVSPASLGVATYAVGMAAVQYFESEKRMTSPSLAALLAGARAGRKEAERKVASLL